MPTAGSRKYTVRARHLDRHHAHTVNETSFEAAAVAYLDNYPPVLDDKPEISVIVRDDESGREHCFVVNLDSGETAACG